MLLIPNECDWKNIEIQRSKDFWIIIFFCLDITNKEKKGTTAQIVKILSIEIILKINLINNKSYLNDY